MPTTILVVLAERRAAEATLRAAGEAATALPGAQIDVLHVRVDPLSTIMASDEVLTAVHRAALEREAEEEGAFLKELYEAWQPSCPPEVPQRWLEVVGGLPGEVARRAREAALVVTGKIGTGSRGHARAAFNAAVFQGRRPVLMVPRRFGSDFASHLLIGWKDSDTTRNAVAAALPWLKAARKVTLLHVTEEKSDLGPALRLLAAGGIAAEALAVPHAGASAGHRLLGECERLGAGGIVIGAYGRNRIIEWIFGGLTSDVLDETSIPVLMKH